MTRGDSEAASQKRVTFVRGIFDFIKTGRVQVLRNEFLATQQRRGRVGSLRRWLELLHDGVQYRRIRMPGHGQISTVQEMPPLSCGERRSGSSEMSYRRAPFHCARGSAKRSGTGRDAHGPPRALLTNKHQPDGGFATSTGNERVALPAPTLQLVKKVQNIIPSSVAHVTV